MDPELAEALRNISQALTALDHRLDAAEAYIKSQGEKQRGKNERELRIKSLKLAQTDALTQWLFELSKLVGAGTKDVLLPRFQAAAQWHLDRRLQQFGDVVPDLAARSDTRPLDQIPTDETPPPILPQ